MFSKLHKITRHTEKRENVTHMGKKGQSRETKPEMSQMLEVSDKNFQVAIITLLKDIKENIITMNPQIGSLSK